MDEEFHFRVLLYAYYNEFKGQTMVNIVMKQL